MLVTQSVTQTVTGGVMRLQRAPLVHVLADIQFSPVLGLAERVPNLQKLLRRLGFPWFGEGEVHEISHAPGAAPKVAVRPFWTFHSPDKTRAITLSERSVSLHTTAYDTVDPFLQILADGAEALRAEVDMELVARLGLRYIDRIVCGAEEVYSDFLDRSMLGFPFEQLNGRNLRPAGIRTESVSETAEGLLVVRSLLVPPKQVVPPDLGVVPLAYPSGLEGLDQPAVLLDFDHFRVYERDPVHFDPDRIVEDARELHALLRHAFDAVVTEHAIERWGPWIKT